MIIKTKTKELKMMKMEQAEEIFVKWITKKINVKNQRLIIKECLEVIFSGTGRCAETMLNNEKDFQS